MPSSAKRPTSRKTFLSSTTKEVNGAASAPLFATRTMSAPDRSSFSTLLKASFSRRRILLRETADPNRRPAATATRSPRLSPRRTYTVATAVT